MVYRRVPVRLWCMYFLDKTHYVIPTLTAGFQLYTLSAGVAYFIAGALSCSVSVKLLKRLLRVPRPDGSRKVTYGMPSTHAAVISYYASYVSAACTALPLHNSLRPFFIRNGVNAFTSLAPLIVIPWASCVVFSRMWLGHHTWKQVGVGVGYGVCFAGMWFTLWTRGGLNVLGNQYEEQFLQILRL